MPTSVPGKTDGAGSFRAALPPPSQRGFSLLELLIVLVIIGIATGLAGFSAFPHQEDQRLRQEAMRLTQLFAIAHAEARAGGRPILWEYDEQGYRFLRRSQVLAMPLSDGAMQPPAIADNFGDDNKLHPRAWSTRNAPTIRVQPAGATLLTAEWMPPPMIIELDDGWSSVRIVRNGAGQYRIDP